MATLSSLKTWSYADLIALAARHRLLTARTFFPKKIHLVRIIERYLTS